MPEQKEHKSDPLKNVDDALNNTNLLTSVEGRMENLRNILDGIDPTEPEPDPEPSTPEPEPEP